jgi:hypothetical protein
MEKITKKAVEYKFNEMCKVNGLATTSKKNSDPNNKDYYENDFYILEYASIYGGYRIALIKKESTGQYTPFGLSRRTAKEMFSLLEGLCFNKEYFK